MRDFKHSWGNKSRLKLALDETKNKATIQNVWNQSAPEDMHISLVELYKVTEFGVYRCHERRGNLGVPRRKGLVALCVHEATAPVCSPTCSLCIHSCLSSTFKLQGAGNLAYIAKENRTHTSHTHTRTHTCTCHFSKQIEKIALAEPILAD